MKLLVAGGRDKWLTKDGFMFLDEVIKNINITEIVQGGCRGIDIAAKQWADYKDIPVITINADWSKYGKSAGPIRNRIMCELCKNNAALFFPGGRGTLQCLGEARKTVSILFDQMGMDKFVIPLEKFDHFSPCNLCYNPICTGLTCTGND